MDLLYVLMVENQLSKFADGIASLRLLNQPSSQGSDASPIMFPYSFQGNKVICYI
jgi:hypothetical protein